jgi:6-phosphogluconolactonase
MIQVFDDLEQLSQAAAELFVERAGHAAKTYARFAVALSGGHTPRRTYQILAKAPYRNRVDWDKVHVFWGDERCVPPGDDRNNAGMARSALLDHVPIPPEQIHPIPGEVASTDAATQYETLLRRFFVNQPARFDLILLGLGRDGHTASLFPGTPVLDERDRWVAHVHIGSEPFDRVTLTVPLINQAAVVAFLVVGKDKAPALQKARAASFDPHQLPARLICPDGDLRWLADRAAADAA